ncbi:MAG: tRNA (N(6)-L-threonylcarbamoyladenosine(37)-C(2))-methylthiotransferase MtaB [Bacilli bacterium]|jgi:threonylcarbamoyladenosine tRNA methylthiotransferase MtaB|nr:tRNA (N(6)-L-threonylcarbamoyladenosine(37)-C(2))-methylthiotransferase MtaB [Bacilli bacterium]
MRTFAIQNLGCKVNGYESNVIARMFEADNYVQVDYHHKADVYIINTCTVTNMGDAKSRKAIRQAVKRNKEAIIVAFGCYAQVSPDEVAGIDGVDIIIGTNQRHLLVDMVNNYDHSKQKIVIDDIMKVSEFEEFGFESYTKNTRAFLKIQEGCNNFCTYCIIPYARGLMRSRSQKSIINEAQKLVEAGYYEIVLTGIHTGGYGIDLEDYNFDDLLIDILNQVPNLQRLRISSIEINQITDRTLRIIKDNPRIARHLHIPLQAGSNEVLRVMKRHYTKEDYLVKINEIRKVLPQIAISTDLIIGFCNETDEYFQEAMTFIKECQFSDMHIFPYSPRKGTPAAQMRNMVSDSTKKERVKEAMMIAEAMKCAYHHQFFNKEVRVLVEDYDIITKMYYGHSSNYLKVFIKDKVNINEFYQVLIDDINNNITGIIIK